MSILAKFPDGSGYGVTKKWVPRPLVTVCGVCSSPATDVQHYGSVSCYSCRAFFRRSVGTGKEYKTCARGSDDCVLDPVNRTNCKKCRFRKCMEIGMRPEKVDRTTRRRIHKADPNQTADQNQLIQTRDPNKTDYRNQLTTCSLSEDAMTVELILNDMECDVTVSNPDPRATMLGSVVSSCLGSSYLKPQASNSSSCLQSVIEGGVSHYSVISPEDAGTSSNSTSCYSQHKSPEQLTGDGSEHSDIDIESLVEDCFAEELMKEVEPISICPTPLMDLTFEEDFRIHQMVVVKENILAKSFEHLTKMPGFQENIRSFVNAIMENQKAIKVILPIHVLELLVQRLPHQFQQIARHTGLDLLEEFVSLDTATKAETIAYSLPIVQICMRSYIQANTDKKFFVRQHMAAGNFHRGFQEAFEAAVPGGRDTLYLLKSFDPINLSIFTSPWAFNYEDEVKFEATMVTLGELVKEDVKLGTLFMFLVLMTPGASTSLATRNNPQLEQIRRELLLLIYRYLRTKFQSSEKGNLVTSRLVSLMDDLHECREIHLHRRISRIYEDLIPDFEQLLRTQDLIFGQNAS